MHNLFPITASSSANHSGLRHLTALESIFGRGYGLPEPRSLCFDAGFDAGFATGCDWLFGTMRRLSTPRHQLDGIATNRSGRNHVCFQLP